MPSKLESLQSTKQQQQQTYPTPPRISKISKIFVTHCHGDHVFGLPGLVCTVLNMTLPKDPKQKDSTTATTAATETTTTTETDATDTNSINITTISPESLGPILDVYGPKGIRRYLSESLAAQGSAGMEYFRLRVRVHELNLGTVTTENAGVDKRGEFDQEMQLDGEDLYPNEVSCEEVVDFDGDNDEMEIDATSSTSTTGVQSNNGGKRDQKTTTKTTRSIFWHVCTTPTLQVTASPIKHGRIQTVGYMIQEISSSGKLQNVKKATEILMRNKIALGIPNPLPLLSKLKNGETLVMPDGNILKPEEYLEKGVAGRRVVVLGDTSDPSEMVPLILSDRADLGSSENGGNDGDKTMLHAPKFISPGYVDLLIHEATNACLKCDIEGLAYDEVTKIAKTTPHDVELQTVLHGHSTPQMAGRFARQVNARKLVLNHFSPRYKGDVEAGSLRIMEEIRGLAVEEFGSEEVLTARDFWGVVVERSGKVVGKG
ncbi:hypothetical protein HDU76_005177 [Blyttiomyces sp. JEL0837]|nr:hypothetical protein HDU76_005177 [Blyttiomyces sp. JEL0837]